MSVIACSSGNLARAHTCPAPGEACPAAQLASACARGKSGAPSARQLASQQCRHIRVPTGFGELTHLVSTGNYSQRRAGGSAAAPWWRLGRLWRLGCLGCQNVPGIDSTTKSCTSRRGRRPAQGSASSACLPGARGRRRCHHRPSVRSVCGNQLRAWRKCRRASVSVQHLLNYLGAAKVAPEISR